MCTIYIYIYISQYTWNILNYSFSIPKLHKIHQHNCNDWFTKNIYPKRKNALYYDFNYISRKSRDIIVFISQGKENNPQYYL